MKGNSSDRLWQKNCPIPLSEESPRIKLGHGEGGGLMRQLLQKHIFPCVDASAQTSHGDSATLAAGKGDLTVTTDSYVISPLFFPGGNIGNLSVFGTLNDLAVSGAQPAFLTLSLILEEGFPIELLEYILKCAAESASEQGVSIVTGDTKVVPWGAADGLFVNTAGVGFRPPETRLGPEFIQEDDELIVTGPIGQHGMAVLCSREEIAFDPAPVSDCGPVSRMAEKLLRELGPKLHSMRDATRGGVAAVLHEWADTAGQTLTVNEPDLPLTPAVRGSCELLGLDPLHVANEGTMVVAVAAGSGAEAVECLKQLPEGRGAKLIGNVEPRGFAPVTISRALGHKQPIDEPMGAPLPRIC